MSSSPGRTADRPESHAESTMRDGGLRSRSRSYTVSGPSANSSAENRGLSARNVPCAAM